MLIIKNNRFQQEFCNTGIIDYICIGRPIAYNEFIASY